MHLTKRAPDPWDSHRFMKLILAQAFTAIMALSKSRPQAGNANRWAVNKNLGEVNQEEAISWTLIT